MEGKVKSEILASGYNAVLKEVKNQESDGPIIGHSNYVVNRLFIAGFDKQTTEEDLKAFFSDLGTVRTVNIVSDKTQRPYGFVTFENKSDCIKILMRKDEFEFHIRGKTLKINPAWYKPARTCKSNPSFKNILNNNSSVLQEMNQVINSNGDSVFCTTFNGTTFFREFPPSPSLPPALPEQVRFSNEVNANNVMYVPMNDKGVGKVMLMPAVNGVTMNPNIVAQPEYLSHLRTPLHQQQAYACCDPQCIGNSCGSPNPMVQAKAINMNCCMMYMQPVTHAQSNNVI